MKYSKSVIVGRIKIITFDKNSFEECDQEIKEKLALIAPLTEQEQKTMDMIL